MLAFLATDLLLITLFVGGAYATVRVFDYFTDPA